MKNEAEKMRRYFDRIGVQIYIRYTADRVILFSAINLHSEFLRIPLVVEYVIILI